MKMKIGTKIGIVLLIFLIQILGFMFLLSAVFYQHEHHMHKLHEDIEKLDLVKNLQLALCQVVMPANDFLISGADANGPENFKILSAKVDDLIERMDKMVFDKPEERKLLNHIKEEHSQIKAIALKIFSIQDAIGNPEAVQLMEEMDRIAADASMDGDKFHQYTHEEIDEAEAGWQRTKNQINLVILSAILFNIIFIMAGLVFFRSTISRPLISLRDTAIEIGRGDLEKRIIITSGDEIGDLATSFNKMAEDLKCLVQKEKELTTIAEMVVASEKKRTVELQRTYKELQETKEGIQLNYEMQTVLNKLLYLSLQTISMEEMLRQFIAQLTSISWLTFEKGSVFLVEDEPGILVMKAQEGLSASLQSMCARIPFGRCLCGRAALSGEIIFTDCVDERHENQYEGMSPHGHYCVPIMSVDKKVLGVINLYIKPDWHRNEKEKEFLAAIANVLAGVIERKKMDESLKVAYIRLQETQDQLIQAEKLNAVGQLASGVAHEVRNPLAIIMQGVDYLEKAISPEEKDSYETLSMVKDSVKRADKIISSLLDFSRATKLVLQLEDINSILEDSLDLIKHRGKFENIEVIKETKKDIPKVSVDKNKMEQVFVNVLLNAIQAMPKGGKIIVRTYDKILEEVKNGIGRRKEDHFTLGERALIVEIEDTGSGIPEGNLKKIFDPFFTTKGPSGGTGLGLSVSRNIIIMHKGLMVVESKVDRGTKVIITLKTAKG